MATFFWCATTILALTIFFLAYHGNLWSPCPQKPRNLVPVNLDKNDDSWVDSQVKGGIKFLQGLFQKNMGFMSQLLLFPFIQQQSSGLGLGFIKGAAVTLSELGEYNRASSLLEELIKKKPSDPDVYRLLGEVKYGLMDYEGSAAAFRMSAMVSGTIDFEVQRGLTNALIAARKPDELNNL